MRSDAFNHGVPTVLWFSKLVLPFVLPPGCCLVLLALGLALLALGRRRAAAAAIVSAFAVLALASAPATARWLAAPLEARFAALDLAAPPRADAIAVLGGGAGPALPPRQDPDIADSSDRVWHAARLFAAGAAPVVIVSGGRAAAVRDVPEEARAMAHLLALWGVPERAIELEIASRNTRENCAAIAEVAARRGWQRVLLVTSALHMPRALRECNAAGITWIPAPTDFRAVFDGRSDLWEWLPESGALDLSAAALKEWLGLGLDRRRPASAEPRASR